jgi:outer membrane immunogenic protein
LNPLTILNNPVLSDPIHCALILMGDAMTRVTLILAAMLAGSVSALAQDSGWPDESETVVQQSEAPAADASGSGWDYDWSGSYFGIAAGYALGAHETVGIGNIDTGSQDLNGGVIGGFLGSNHQFSRIIVGSEMDFSMASLSGPFSLPGSTVACNAPGVDCSTDVDWVASLRGRAGFAVYDFLPYVTAGLAAGGVNTNFEGPGVDTSISGVGLGWVLGAGVEYAVMKHLNVRGEVLHYDLSGIEDTVLGTDVKADTQFTVVRMGASLKF